MEKKGWIWGRLQSLKVIIWKPVDLRGHRMSPKSSKHCSLDKESDGIGRGRHWKGWGNMALGPNPHPPSPPQRQPPPTLPQLCSFPRAVQWCSAGFLSILLGCPGLLQMLRSPGAMPGILDFSQLRLLCCNPDKPVLFEFLLCYVHLARCQEAQVWLGGWALAPVHSTAHCRFPRQRCLTIPGSGPLLTVEGIFLLLFPSLLPLLHLSCSLFSRIPNGSLWSLQDSSCISPFLSHHIYLFVPFFWVWGKLLTLIFQMTNLDFGSIQTIVWPPLHFDILMIIFAFPTESTFWFQSYSFHRCNLCFV